MKRAKLFFLALVIMGISFITSSLPVKADTEDAFYDKIIKKEEIVIGLSADYPPYEFHSTVDGKDEIVGFDISVAQDIADGLGVKLKIEELGFDALIGALKTGKIDAIISGISPTEERLKEVNFTIPYMDVVQTVVVRKEDQEKYKSVNDFEGAKVGVQKQTTQEALAKAELIGAKTTSLQKVTDMMPTLLTKKVDAVVLEGPVAQAYVTAYPDNYAFADVTFENGDKQTAIAIPKDSPILEEKINTIITEIKSDGRLKKYQENAAELMFSDDESFISKYGDYFVKGTINTILLAIIGVFFGATFGIVFALMKLSEIAPIRWIANIYIEYVRGTPLLVQIFLVYFGTTVLNIDISAFASGCIALSLNSAAYVAEIIRAGINAVNKGQMEASRSLGMTRTQALRYIIMPQAVKNILPALGNEFVTVIKESSVVSVIGVSELMFQTGNVQGASFQFFAPYAIASLIYFVLTFSISRLLGVAERRMSTSD